MDSRPCFVAFCALLTGLVGCSTPRSTEVQREPVDRNSAAYKTGQAAHKVANGAEKAASVAAQKLAESARKAREGWKEQSRIDREKKRSAGDRENR